MLPGYKISSKAYKDIEHIRSWYDERSLLAGNWFLDELYLYILKFSKNPEQFRLVDTDVRKCSLKKFPYIVFFSVEKNIVVVLRVRHIKQRSLKRFT